MAIVPKLGTTGVLLALALGLCCAAPDIETPRRLALKLTNEELNRIDQQPHDTKVGEEPYDLSMEDPPSLYVESLDVTMVGKTLHSLYDRNISAFQGIKYAEFPKEQRFMHSNLVGSIWGADETVIVNHVAEKCTQYSSVFDSSNGQEDCLYLNVYLPENPLDLTDLPVMVFIHGGGFSSGETELYLPSRLLDHDVILVTVAYRLGALGWLSAQTENIPGNAGLSDQMNALRWVQKHIASFGGNPDMVTLFGESAGAVSVSLIQTVAPEEERLFSSVIVESGSALEYWAIDQNPIESFNKFAEICGCSASTRTYEEVLACLTVSKSDRELSDCTHMLQVKERNEGRLGFAATSPVVQTENVGEEQRLIAKMPIEYILNMEANDVPMIMGANRDEGSIVLGEMYLYYLEPKGYLNDSDYLNNQIISDILAAVGVNDPSKTIATALQKDYFPGVDMSTFDACIPGLVDMLGVLILKGGTYETALYHSQYYNSSTYFYSFDFISEDSVFNWIFAGDDLPFGGGVAHADELMYIFSLPSQLTDEQRLTSKRLTKLWTNFATSKDPTPDDSDDEDELDLPTWEELDDEGEKYYLIQDSLTVESDYTKRWHIEMDTASGGTTYSPSGTTPPSGATVSLDDYNKVKQERDDYLITMCVFIVAFVAADCALAYLWFRRRG